MTIAEVLDEPLEQVCKVVLLHNRRSTFRWFVLLEVLVFGVLLCCIFPFLILMVLLGVGPELPGIDELLRGRSFYHWHELTLKCFGPTNQVLRQALERVGSEAEGDHLVAAVLGYAQSHGLVVQQRIGAQNSAVWYGGQPLLSDPMCKPAEEQQKCWERNGGRIVAGEVVTELRYPCRPVPRFVAFFGLLGLGPVLWVFANGRNLLRELLDNLKGEAPWEWVFEIKANHLSGKQIRVVSRSVEPLVRHGHEVLGEELLAIGWGPTLGFDRYVSERRPRLRWVCREKTVEWPFPEDADLGKALRDLLIAGVLTHRAQRPELGLPFDRTGLTRCTGCAQPFVFSPSATCPSCSNPPARGRS
jgi:hypothetical protein